MDSYALFFKLKSTPRNTNCPRCQSTDTFPSMYNDARYCVSCHQRYDRTDEVRLKERKMTTTQIAEAQKLTRQWTKKDLEERTNINLQIRNQ